MTIEKVGYSVNFRTWRETTNELVDAINLLNGIGGVDGGFSESVGEIIENMGDTYQLTSSTVDGNGDIVITSSATDFILTNRNLANNANAKSDSALSLLGNESNLNNSISGNNVVAWSNFLYSEITSLDNNVAKKNFANTFTQNQTLSKADIRLHIKAPTTGSTNVNQRAMLTVGEATTSGASLKLIYHGNGEGFVGMGSVSSSYDDNMQHPSLRFTHTSRDVDFLGTPYVRSYTPSTGVLGARRKIWHAGNHGIGSGLNADLLDGKHASAFSLNNHSHPDIYYKTEADNTFLKLTGGALSGHLTLNLNSGTTSRHLYLQRSTTYRGDMYYSGNSFVFRNTTENDSTAFLRYYINNAEKLRIEKDNSYFYNALTVTNNAGLTSTKFKLSSNGTAASPAISFSGNSSNTGFFSLGTDQINITTNGNVVGGFRSGRLGLGGNTDPSHPLDVTGNARISGNIIVNGLVDGVDISSLATDLTNAAFKNQQNVFTFNQFIQKADARFHIDSSSGGSNNVSQRAMLTVGETQLSATSLKLIYHGNGEGYIGMGAVSSNFDDNMQFPAIRLAHNSPDIDFLGTPYVRSYNSNNGALTNRRKIWHEGNDGAGSGLHADLLDGYHANQFYRSNQNFSTTGSLTTSKEITANGFFSNENIVLNDRKTLVFSGGSNSITTYNLAHDSSGLILRKYVGNNYVEQGEVWSAGNHGSGSGLDADKLDGKHGYEYAEKALQPSEVLYSDSQLVTSKASQNTWGTSSGDLVLADLFSNIHNTNDSTGLNYDYYTLTVYADKKVPSSTSEVRFQSAFWIGIKQNIHYDNNGNPNNSSMMGFVQDSSTRRGLLIARTDSIQEGSNNSSITTTGNNVATNFIYQMIIPNIRMLGDNWKTDDTIVIPRNWISAIGYSNSETIDRNWQGNRDDNWNIRTVTALNDVNGSAYNIDIMLKITGDDIPAGHGFNIKWNLVGHRV